jgi:hypothetical protein
LNEELKRSVALIGDTDNFDGWCWSGHLIAFTATQAFGHFGIMCQ